MNNFFEFLTRKISRQYDIHRMSFFIYRNRVHAVKSLVFDDNRISMQATYKKSFYASFETNNDQE